MSVVDPRFTVEGISAAILVFGGWSLIWKDNPWFQWSSHVIMAFYVGNMTLGSIQSILNLGWNPLLAGKYILIVPILLGVLCFARYSKKVFWLARYPMSFLVGISTAMMMRGWLDSMLLKPISTTIKIFAGIKTPFGIDTISNIVFLVFLFTSSYCFIFSLPFTRPKPIGYVIKIGRWGLMSMLGLYFGSTILMRLQTMLAPMLFFMLGLRA